MAILCVNAGSSTLKFSLHPVQGDAVQAAVLSGNFQSLEPGGQPHLSWNGLGLSGKGDLPPSTKPPFEQALARLQSLLQELPGVPALQAVAHRVVHGGERFRESVVVDEEILTSLASLNEICPLHQPHNLAGIRAFQSAFPGLPQVACFDTAFHTTVGPVEYTFAIPRELSAKGLRRYGFHGLSYQYLNGQLKALSPKPLRRVIMCHLGNGSSLCAVKDGESLATSMGFTALDGLMMGTRTGNIDPGVLLYLMEQGWDHDRLQTMLYKKSGLLGVSGVSADMRTLRADGSPAALEAIELYAHRLVRELGGLAACLEGVEAIVFAGGIGENDAEMRATVCQRLGWLGVDMDPKRNAERSDQARTIHTSSSRVQVWVIPTDEGIVAAGDAARLLAAAH